MQATKTQVSENVGVGDEIRFDQMRLGRRRELTAWA